MSTGDKTQPQNSAESTPDLAPDQAVQRASPDVLSATSDPALTEDRALALLKHGDLPAEALNQLSKNAAVMKSRKVKLAIIEHPRTPRHVSIPMVRTLFTFDLMQVALTPIVPADIKRAAEEALANRLEAISSGERLSLAHRASGRVAGELLLDSEPRVIHAALENPRLIELSIVRALARHDAPGTFVEAVSHHAKWSSRREIRVALLRNEKTPLARALEFARSLPPAQVREILHGSHLSARTKAYLLKDTEERSKQSGHFAL